MLIGVAAGQPVTSVSNVALAAVILPLASTVLSSVNVPLPLQLASAPVMGGTSFDDFMSALKTNFVWGVGDGEGVGLGRTVGDGDGAVAAPPQALRTSAPAASPANRRMGVTSLPCA